MRLGVGLVQMHSVPLRVEDNLSKAEGLVELAVKAGADLIVLPEMFGVGFYTMEELMDAADSLESGKMIDWLRSIAVRNNVHMTCSLYERHEGHYYNTMVMVGADGRSQFYRKRSPTWMELTVWRRSDQPGPGIFETPFGRIGGAICFDSFARESFLGFQQSRVDLVIIIALWGVPLGLRRDLSWAASVMKRWSHLASQVVPQKYAAELGVPSIFVNQSGTIPSPCLLPPPYPRSRVNLDFKFIGNSSAWDASGRILMDGRGRAQDFENRSRLFPL